MSLSPLLPVAGLTLGSLAIRAAQQLASGPSFAELLRVGGDRSTEKSPAVDKLAGLRAETRSLQEQLQQRLQQLFARHGIDLAQPIELRLDDGEQLGVGPHPDQETLERLLAAEPGLREQFRQWAAKVRTLRESETGGIGPRDVRLIHSDGEWRVRS